MTTATTERTRAADSFVAAAAWCLVAAGVLPLALPVAANVAAHAGSPWHGLFIGLTTLQHLLVLGGIAGLGHSGAMGRGRLGRIGTVLAIAAFAALALAELTNDLSKTIANVLYGFGTLGAASGLLLVGAATIRARRWASWRRFTPLASGLFLVVVVMPSFALPGRAFGYFIGLWGITFLLLGIAMLTEPSNNEQVSRRLNDEVSAGAHQPSEPPT